MTIYIICFGEFYVGPFESLEKAMEFADRQDADYKIKAVISPNSPEYIFK